MLRIFPMILICATTSIFFAATASPASSPYGNCNAGPRRPLAFRVIPVRVSPSGGEKKSFRSRSHSDIVSRSNFSGGAQRSSVPSGCPGGARRGAALFSAAGSDDVNGSSSFSSPPFRSRWARRNASSSSSRTGSSEAAAVDERRLADIFVGGNGAMVKLMLAGRWSQRIGADADAGSDDLSVSRARKRRTTTVDMLLLCFPSDCKSMYDRHQSLLQSSSSETSQPQQRRRRTKQQLQLGLSVPIPPSSSRSALRLLSHAYHNRPLSKSVLLTLNSALVNRDGGLFDNLPWATWSVDPDLRERDAARNVVDPKYALGKRVAYQRFMGKDWQGRSLSLGNLALKIKYWLESSDDDEDDDKDDRGENQNSGAPDDPVDDTTMMASLSQRMMELEIKEARMDVAEYERQLAVARARQNYSAQASTEPASRGETFVAEEFALEDARDRLRDAESSLETFEDALKSEGGEDTNAKGSAKLKSILVAILDKMAEQKNPPPYRGAIGYPAKLDTEKEALEDSVLPYSSPYELMLEIFSEQLNSDVVGCILESASLLNGNLVLGGAILLRRRGRPKKTTILEEEVNFNDEEDDYGNEGISPGSLCVVECRVDEAVGVALSAGLPVHVEEGIWDRAKFPVDLNDDDRASQYDDRVGTMDRIPPVLPTDDRDNDFPVQVEGERVSSDGESNRVRIPLNTNPDLFDDAPPIMAQTSLTGGVFSNYNPVRSLIEYDALTVDGKARILLRLESFRGTLPRPRAVKSGVLDDILLPLIDETVRRQYLVRSAEQRGDFDEANALRNEMSSRQEMIEAARIARDDGRDEDAERLESEAKLYGALRADVTQDEGAYSRFLDRDEWYERETQARIKRLDRKKFGTLLDGMDE